MLHIRPKESVWPNNLLINWLFMPISSYQDISLFLITSCDNLDEHA